MKALLTAIALLLCVSIHAQIPEPPTQGSGTIDDPYHIEIFNHLVWLNYSPERLLMHYRQTADLDASSSQEMNSGHGWMPIGSASNPFTGSYDGQGYQITGLWISRNTTQRVGLFGYVEGAGLNRIHLRGIQILGSSFTGGLAGFLNASIVNNCSVTGSVSGADNVGGLTGYCSYGSVITNSYSHASVYGFSQTGGFVGQTSPISNNGYIYRCYSTGAVTCPDWSGGGFIGGYGGYIYDCFWNSQTSGYTTGPSGALPKTTSELKQRATYENWNFSTQWSILEGLSYPDLASMAAWSLAAPLSSVSLPGSGTPEDPYLISTADQLNAMRLHLNASYRLTASLDLSSTVAWNHGQGWLSVGSADSPFTGVLDGDGFEIANLCINRPRTDNNGLFGYASDAWVHKLTLQDFITHGGQNCGGLAGRFTGGTVEDVHVSGFLVASTYSGGILGRLNGGLMQRCSSNSAIRSGSDYIGGLMGYLTGDANGPGSVAKCVSRGSIKAGWQLGGIVGGLAWGSVANSYSHASLYGVRNLGGIAGLVGGSNPGYVSQCYTTGLIELAPGGSFSGGITGYINNGNTQQSYWNTDTTGIPNDAFNNGRSTAQMTWPGSETTFAAWDFTNIWRHDSSSLQNNGYPFLAWQEAPVPDAVQNLMIFSAAGQIMLEWQAVPGISLYNIYASDDPYAPFDQWSFLGQSGSPSFSTTASSKRFFIVRSVAE